MKERYLKMYGQLLYWMLGGGPFVPRDKPAEVCQWEDDGGPALPDPEPYTHVIKAATQPWSNGHMTIESSVGRDLAEKLTAAEDHAFLHGSSYKSTAPERTNPADWPGVVVSLDDLYDRCPLTCDSHDCAAFGCEKDASTEG